MLEGVVVVNENDSVVSGFGEATARGTRPELQHSTNSTTIGGATFSTNLTLLDN